MAINDVGLKNFAIDSESGMIELIYVRTFLSTRKKGD
jgi:hypothetical protein